MKEVCHLLYTRDQTLMLYYIQKAPAITYEAGLQLKKAKWQIERPFKSTFMSFL